MDKLVCAICGKDAGYVVDGQFFCLECYEVKYKAPPTDLHPLVKCLPESCPGCKKLGYDSLRVRDVIVYARSNLAFASWEQDSVLTVIREYRCGTRICSNPNKRGHSCVEMACPRCAEALMREEKSDEAKEGG